MRNKKLYDSIKDTRLEAIQFDIKRDIAFSKARSFIAENLPWASIKDIDDNSLCGFEIKSCTGMAVKTSQNVHLFYPKWKIDLSSSDDIWEQIQSIEKDKTELELLREEQTK